MEAVVAAEEEAARLRTEDLVDRLKTPICRGDGPLLCERRPTRRRRHAALLRGRDGAKVRRRRGLARANEETVRLTPAAAQLVISTRNRWQAERTGSRRLPQAPPAGAGSGLAPVWPEGGAAEFAAGAGGCARPRGGCARRSHRRGGCGNVGARAQRPSQGRRETRNLTRRRARLRQGIRGARGKAEFELALSIISVMDG